MPRYLLITPSVTHALKGRDILRKMGFAALVERKNSQDGNCGFGIVTDGNIKKAEQALRNASVKILEIRDY